MAHAIWNGSINFGLVSIPVKLFPAIRSSEGIHFHLLHDKDEGRIHNVRKCEECGQEIPWEHVDKGWEYAKGSYVVIDDKELEKLKPEATQSVDILEFVDANDIDSMLYDTPYYVEPDKRGRRAYSLLRESLKKSGKVGIAKVVLRTREHLAAVKPVGRALVIELMHFGNEIVNAEQFELPAANDKLPESEMENGADAHRQHDDPLRSGRLQGQVRGRAARHARSARREAIAAQGQRKARSCHEHRQPSGCSEEEPGNHQKHRPGSHPRSAGHSRTKRKKTGS